MELKIHPIQADVLIVLLFKPKCKFSQLNTTRMSTDHFTFHVKRLIELGLVKKIEGSNYKLTTKGKEFANRFDTDSAAIERQAKISVLVCCVKKNRGVPKYLVQQRLKQPYYGFHGFVTAKVRWGELIQEAAARELKEETGYVGNLRLVGIKHKLDYTKHGNLLEDKFFYVIKATSLKGKLIKRYDSGKNLWLTEEKIGGLPNLFDGVGETIKMVKQDELVFSETKYEVSKY